MRTKTGIVTSHSGIKSFVVEVYTYTKHPKYHKRFRKTSKFHVHCEADNLTVGQTITIGETRPVSKLKRWTVIEDTAANDNTPAATTEKAAA